MKKVITKFLANYGVLFSAVLGVALLSSYFIAANAATAEHAKAKKEKHGRVREFIIDKKETKKKPAGKCGLENCHGMDFVCSDKPAEFCTEMYAMGDFCRQYAKCEIVKGKCGLKKSLKLERCIDCVKACLSLTSEEQRECEDQCRTKVK